MQKKSKKLLSIMLCVILLIGVSRSCLAASLNDSEIIQIDTTVDRLNPEDFEEANNALVARGQVAMRQRAAKSLTVKHFYQDGGQIWSEDIMQELGKTIKSAGCCLTSFSMIQEYLGGIYNPRGVNNKLGNAACSFQYTTAANIFGYSISNYEFGTVTDTYAKEFIIGAIDFGYPVLVGMAPDDTSKNTHFVTAYGYSGDTIYIHDPASGRDYSTLNTYLNSYYVNRLYVYTK